ncbi:zeta-sarcoglycan isoform X3 [Centroberyx affinis]|uniref:zeta-sarcoglycan isoform X3 n=1 Tax=Centroberyx affinis TaxID=166261 RepID=UPI003A5BECE1
MEQSTTLDIETLKITQEQYILASQSLHLQRPGSDAVYPVGLYGWRKRCFYFFLLLLLVIMIVNLALTVWIIKVMNFSVDGMGNLQLNQDGIRLEGISEFLLPLYVNEIQSRRDSSLVLRSEKNVTLNARNNQGQLTGQLTVGSEGAVFGHSVETPLIQARTSEDLKLESPTRTLTMEAPRGVEVSAATGTLKVGGRKDLQLQSTEGEILLDAGTIRLGSLPLGVYTDSPPGPASQKQPVYEVCVCPSGKIYLSPAESSSTCQAMSNICLWS